MRPEGCLQEPLRLLFSSACLFLWRSGFSHTLQSADRPGAGSVVEGHLVVMPPVLFVTTSGSHSLGPARPARERSVNPRGWAGPAGSTCEGPGAHHGQAHVVAHTPSIGTRQWGELGPVPPGGEDGADLRVWSPELRHPCRQVGVRLSSFLLGLPLSWPEHRGTRPSL